MSGADDTADNRAYSRRLLLMGALTATGCSAGCFGGRSPGTSAPSASGPSGASPTAPAAASSPSTTAVQQAVSIEARLLVLSEAVLRHPDVANLGTARRRAVAGARLAHLDHLAALRSPDPTVRPLPGSTPPVPPPVRKLGAVDTALTTLQKAEGAAAGGHRHLAETATGLPGLLFASLAVAADGFGAALGTDSPPAPPPPPTTRAAPPPGSSVDAEQDLLAQVYAMIYGYKAALGNTSATSGMGKRLQARLTNHLELRDQLTSLVVAGGATPVVAAPAYRLPLQITDSAAARTLVRRLEQALLPHLGRWVAATSPGTHKQALDQLFAGAASAMSWGAGAPTWPGWLP